MQLLCYPLLGTKTRRLMRRRWRSKRWGLRQPYRYRPQYRLILRLMSETGMSEQAVRQQIYKERLFLLRQDWGEDQISAADV